MLVVVERKMMNCTRVSGLLRTPSTLLGAFTGGSARIRRQRRRNMLNFRKANSASMRRFAPRPLSLKLPLVTYDFLFVCMIPRSPFVVIHYFLVYLLIIICIDYILWYCIKTRTFLTFSLPKSHSFRVPRNSSVQQGRLS